MIRFIRLKLYFLTLFSGFGSILPYLSLYYRSTLGFSSFQVGVLTAAIPVANFLLLPVFTNLADRHQCPRLILVLSSLISSLITVALIVVTSQVAHPDFWVILLIIGGFAAFLSPLTSILDSIILDTLASSDEEDSQKEGPSPTTEGAKQDGSNMYGRQRMIGSLAYGSAAYITANFFDVSSTSSHSSSGSNTATNVTLVAATDGPMNNGTSFVGANSTSLDAPREAGLSVIFYGYVAAVGICFVLVLLWPDGNVFKNYWNRFRRSVLRQKVSSEDKLQLRTQSEVLRSSSIQNSSESLSERRRSSLLSVRTVPVPSAPTPNTGAAFIPPPNEKISFFGAIRTIIQYKSPAGSPFPFWLFVFVQGFSLSIINNYLYFMLVDRLNAPNQVLGLTSIMRVALEIPFFYYSGAVMQFISKNVSKIVPISSEHAKIDAMRWTMAISMMLLSIRLGLYTAMSYFRWNAWVDVGVELLHGMIYATFYSAAVQLAASLAPTHLQATSQGLFGAIFTGFGSTIGSLLGGVINEAIGPTFLYSILFILDVFTVSLYVISILRSTRARGQATGLQLGESRREEQV